LAWDVTVVDTVADSYLHLSSVIAGAAAENAATRKTAKYTSLPPDFLFCPVAFETFGALCNSALDLFSLLGSRISEISGDTRETSFLSQRVSVLIQKFNYVSFRGSFIIFDEL
jgi:hypothetical protein